MTALADAKTFSTINYRLQSGTVMPEVTIAYATLGTLAPDRSNAVLVTHGNTSGPHIIDPGGTTGEGSWSEIVGPGKAVDTNRYFAICPNMLGSSYGSTNAGSIDPATGKPYGPRFPDINVSDIVGTQRLLLDHLGIDKLVAIVGPSYGGFQALQWAVNYPDAMKGIVAVVTSPLVPRERSEGNVARLLGALSKDPNWNGGDYYDRGGVVETMTADPHGDAEDLWHRGPPESDDVRSRGDRGRDPRRGGALGRGIRRQFADHPGQSAPRLRRDGAVRPDQIEGSVRAVADGQIVSA